MADNNRLVAAPRDPNAGLRNGPINPRQGAPKKLTPPAHSWGNTGAQRATLFAGGLGHATSTAQVPDASSANPLDPSSGPAKPYLNKCAPLASGMRSRTSHGRDLQELSDAVRAEAFAVGSHADRLAHGRDENGHLPDAISDDEEQPVRKP